MFYTIQSVHGSMNVTKRIQTLKADRDALILAHNYCSPQVQDVADFVGDSLALAIRATDVKEKVIVLCGVTFMAESVKILNPEKRIIIPEPDAVCPMANMCSGAQLDEERKLHPQRKIVGYVNTSADAKAHMDVCCTSANALKVVDSLRGEEVLFVPDKNLGDYVSLKLKRDITLWGGFCPTHQAITVQSVRVLREKHPDAVIMAHPECRREVLHLADFIGSTSQMLEYARTSDNDIFIVLTEIGLSHRLQQDSPKKTFLFPDVALCPTMKMTDLSSVLRALETMSSEIQIDPAVLRMARTPLERMVSIR